MIDSTLLTNIADAVRSVDGSTNTLTPAQMQARLTAVKSSIDAALSALTAKEVAVPSGSNVHGLAALIASIETGGASGFAKVAKGSMNITSFSGATTLTIEHGLGQMPDIAVLYDTNEFTDNPSIGACIMLSSGAFVNAGYNRGNQSSNRRGVYFGTNGSMDETSFTVQGKLHYGGSSSASNIRFTYGLSYIWIVGVYAS